MPTYRMHITHRPTGELIKAYSFDTDEATALGFHESDATLYDSDHNIELLRAVDLGVIAACPGNRK